MAAPTFVADEIVTAVKMNSLPKGLIAVATKTANQAGIGTTITDITGLTVTFTAEAARRYKVSAFVNTRQSGAIGGTHLYVTTGSNVDIALARGTAHAANYVVPLNVFTVITPAAGSVTYKCRASTDGGTTSIEGSATQPCTLLVEDLGSV